MKPSSPRRPRIVLAPLVLVIAVTALQPACATSQRLTNLNDPSCGDAVHGAVQSLLTHYESPEASAALADLALSDLQKSSPPPASFAVVGGPSTRTFGFIIEARAGACVIVLQTATLYDLASFPPSQEATLPSKEVTVGTPRNRSSAFERVLPICVCGP